MLCVRYLLCGNVYSLVMFIAVLPLHYLDLKLKLKFVILLCGSVDDPLDSSLGRAQRALMEKSVSHGCVGRHSNPFPNRM